MNEVITIKSKKMDLIYPFPVNCKHTLIFGAPGINKLILTNRITRNYNSTLYTLSETYIELIDKGNKLPSFDSIIIVNPSIKVLIRILDNIKDKTKPVFFFECNSDILDIHVIRAYIGYNENFQFIEIV